jgi:hypothetical protein
MKVEQFVANIYTNFRYCGIFADYAYERAAHICVKYREGNIMKINTEILDMIVNDFKQQIKHMDWKPIIEKSANQNEMNKEFVLRFCKERNVDQTILEELIYEISFTSMDRYVLLLINNIANRFDLKKEDVYVDVMNALCLTEHDF